MPRKRAIREPGPLTAFEARQALRRPDRAHLPIWESLEPGVRDASFLIAIHALGREARAEKEQVAA
jgi:hypothetical protein